MTATPYTTAIPIPGHAASGGYGISGSPYLNNTAGISFSGAGTTPYGAAVPGAAGLPMNNPVYTGMGTSPYGATFGGGAAMNPAGVSLR